MSRSTGAIIKVAVGIIINHQQQVLIALRPQHTSHAGLWEFPGGKFEINENALDALKRELKEEIGIEVISASPLLCIQHDYGSIKVELDAWQITEYSGHPHGCEGQEIRWVDSYQLQQLNFPEGNYEILKTVTTILNIKD